MVTVNNFLADGGDNFTTFRQVDPSLRVGGGIDLDELNNYLASGGSDRPAGDKPGQRTALIPPPDAGPDPPGVRPSTSPHAPGLAP